MASSSIRRVGHAQGVLLPKPVLSDLGLRIGVVLALVLEEGGSC